MAKTVTQQQKKGSRDPEREIAILDATLSILNCFLNNAPTFPVKKVATTLALASMQFPLGQPGKQTGSSGLRGSVQATSM